MQRKMFKTSIYAAIVLNREFRKEVTEILGTLQTSCNILREGMDNQAITEIMKSSHKFKGIAGMMDYSHISELAGEMESVSKLLMEDTIHFQPEIASLLSASTNLLGKYVDTDFEERNETLLENLRKLTNNPVK